MDLINLSTEGAKAEVFSTTCFSILIAIVFLTASIGFWLFNKIELAKAYVTPNLIAVLLILIAVLLIILIDKKNGKRHLQY